MVPALQEYLIYFDHKFINKCVPVWKITTLLMVDILSDLSLTFSSVCVCIKFFCVQANNYATLVHFKNVP